MRVLERRPATRCSYCHGDLEREPRRCAACGTATHAGCFDEQACPTLGCAGVLPTPKARPRSSWLRVACLVAALVGLPLLLLLGTARTSCGGRSPWGTVHGDLHMLQAASSMFQADHRRFPRTVEELAEPEGRGPYLFRAPIDPWGRAYHLLPGERGARPVFGTLGADGVVGGEGLDGDHWSDDRHLDGL